MGQTFESVAPATGEVLGSFPRSSAADVDAAVATAKAAFEDWRLVPAPERGNILFRFAELLRTHKDELTDLMTREMGKVKAEAGGDVQEAIDMSLYMAGEGRRLYGQTTPSELRDKFMMSVRMPVGVVGAITPWNFPIAIPAWKLAPALVCGDTVVLKPAEDTPLLAERFVEILTEAGCPAGVVNVVHGFGESAGEALVRHPDVPIITFTGSRATGVAVTKAGADHLKHVHLELGGKNAIIRLDDSDPDLAVAGDVDREMRMGKGEIFGPTTALIEVRDFDEALEVANGIQYGLSSSIFTRDVNNAFRAMRDLQAGITYINAGTTGAEVHLPFGGTKDTGNGHREAGQAALDVFTEWKSIYVDYSGRLQRAQIDNV